MGGQRHAQSALPPGKQTRYPLYRRLGEGPQYRSGRVRKDSPSTGIRTPRTVQPVASRYYRLSYPDPLETNHVYTNAANTRLDKHPAFGLKQ